MRTVATALLLTLSLCLSQLAMGSEIVHGCKCDASVVEVPAPTSQPKDSTAACGECTTVRYFEVTNNGNCEIDRIEIIAKSASVLQGWGWIENTGNVWEHTRTTGSTPHFVLITGKSGAGTIVGVGGKNRTFIIKIGSTEPHTSIIVVCQLQDGTKCNSTLSL